MTISQRVLVPMDGSEAAAHAARFGKAMAEGLGVPVELVHVHPIGHGEAAGMAQLGREQLAAAAADAGSRAFGSMADDVPEAQRHVCWGDPATEILRLAEGPEPALVVLGRSGAGNVQRLVMGSVSAKVLEQAQGPVVIVP